MFQKNINTPNISNSIIYDDSNDLTVDQYEPMTFFGSFYTVIQINNPEVKFIIMESGRGFDSIIEVSNNPYKKYLLTNRLNQGIIRYIKNDKLFYAKINTHENR